MRVEKNARDCSRPGIVGSCEMELAGTAVGNPNRHPAKRQLDKVRNRRTTSRKEQQKAPDDVANKSGEH